MTAMALAFLSGAISGVCLFVIYGLGAMKRNAKEVPKLDPEIKALLLASHRAGWADAFRLAAAVARVHGDKIAADDFDRMSRSPPNVVCLDPNDPFDAALIAGTKERQVMKWAADRKAGLA
jgi:hypothetical protein